MIVHEPAAPPQAPPPAPTLPTHRPCNLEIPAQQTGIDQGNMTRRWIFHAILSGLLLLVAAGILVHPVATNDGPVHVAFAHLMLSYHQPSQPLQSEAYVLHLRPNPNLGVYFLMAGLMRFLSPASAESIIQILCILGPVLAGYFALRMINRRNVWLSIFFLPLALNQMFFLGLYNHCISIAAFLFAIGTYFWLSKAPSYPRASALAGSLVLTFLCHASGFLMAFCSMAAMIVTHTVLRSFRDRQLLSALRAQRFAILAMVLPLPLGALFLASGEKSITKYGFTFPYRLKQFAELHLLSANYPLRDRFVAMLLSALLLSSLLGVCIRVFSKRTHPPRQQRDQAAAAIMATLTATIIVFAFPDIMGGGWTHFRRFEIFPFLWMVLVLAFVEWPSRAVAAFTAVAAGASLFLITSMSIRQGMVREQMAPLAKIDTLVGAHCSVLPVVLQAYLIDPAGNPDLMDYQPFFQAASRLELHDDRVDEVTEGVAHVSVAA